MFNKKLLTAAAASALMGAAAQVQAFEIAGNVALTTDYRFRGISQSDEDPAIQGGFDAGLENGLYIGTWGSSIDFGDSNDTGSFGTLELDYYAGWAGPIGDSNFGLDVGYIYYDYPGDTVNPKGDFGEAYIGVSWKDLSFKTYYSDDFYAETDEAWYFTGDYSFTLLDALSIGLHAGYSSFDDDDGPFPAGGGLDGTDEYWDYSVSVSYTWATVDWTLAWVDTDMSKDDVGEGIEELADSTAVFSISKSL